MKLIIRALHTLELMYETSYMYNFIINSTSTKMELLRSKE